MANHLKLKDLWCPACRN